MKRYILLILLSISMFSVYAEDYEENGIKYTILSEADKTCEVSDSSIEISGDIVIPEEVIINSRSYRVISIGVYAFKKCYYLKSVVIPNSVITIGDFAFSECESLTSIEIPNSVISIGDYTFSSCESLTSIEIPDSVISIGDGAFSHCESLTSIVIPNSVTSIGIAFIGCYKMTNINVDKGNIVYSSLDGVLFSKSQDKLIAFPIGRKGTYSIPESVCVIGKYAFARSSLTSVQISNTVTTIEKFAFEFCINLTSINIPDSVTTIGSGAFWGCVNLTSINIPNSVKSIGDRAFYNCTSLTSIDLSDSINTIEEMTFYRCKSLTSVKIPNSVTSIGDDAFFYCESLTSIEIPELITSIGEKAFCGCENLSKVTCHALTPPSLGNNVFKSNPSQSILYVPFAAIKAYNGSGWNNEFYSVRPYDYDYEFTYNGIRYSVMNWKYNRCKAIGLDPDYFKPGTTDWNISVPDKAKYAEYGQEFSVTKVEETAFAGCPELKVIELPSTMTSILDRSFKDCTGLEVVRIPKSITYLGIEAFFGCDKLNKVICYAITPPALSNKVYVNPIPFDDNTYKTCRLYVPQAARSKYLSAEGWESFLYLNAIETLPKPTSVTLNKSALNIEARQEYQLVASILPADAYDIITWKSSDESVATVTTQGLLKAVSPGYAKITATCNGVSSSCGVTVSTSGVNEIEYDENQNIEVFTLSGMRLGITTPQDLQSLPPGIYIVKNGSLTYKLMLP